MFSMDYQVNIHHRDGEVQRYILIENQDDKHLVVVHPSVVEEMSAYISRGGHRDDGLIALLMDEAMVLDRKKGTPLPLAQANDVLAASEYAPLRRAGMLRQPLPETTLAMTGEDLAWAFGLELARRNLAA